MRIRHLLFPSLWGESDTIRFALFSFSHGFHTGTADAFIPVPLASPPCDCRKPQDHGGGMKDGGFSGCEEQRGQLRFRREARSNAARGSALRCAAQRLRPQRDRDGFWVGRNRSARKHSRTEGAIPSHIPTLTFQTVSQGFFPHRTNIQRLNCRSRIEE